MVLAAIGSFSWETCVVLKTFPRLSQLYVVLKIAVAVV